MGSGFGDSNNNVRWSVFDGVRIIAATPEALMAEIDSAISSLEYARATAALDSAAAAASSSSAVDGGDGGGYDARVADEAYKEGCVALAAGKLEEALRSLKVSLSKCPPDKTAAVAKLRSLISLTSQQIQNQRSSN